MLDSLGTTWLLLIALATVLVSGTICVRAMTIGRRLGVLDLPDGRRKIHPAATPLVGGLAVMLPVLAMALVLAAFTVFTPFYLTLAAAGVCCLLLGLRDDRAHIRPLYRLLLSLLLAWLALLAVPALEVTFFRFSVSGEALFLDALAPIFTILCIVGLQNAVNMADGKNGVVIDLCLFWTADLALFAPDHLRPMLLALAAALSVTLVFNLRGKLFLGDSGSYALSFLFALLAIYVYGVGFVRLPADLVALWFLIPVVDCLRLMAKRALRGGSPFASDREHLHHIIYRRLPWSWGLPLYLGLAGLPGLLASIWPNTTMAWGAVALVCYAVLIAWPSRARKEAGLASR